MIEELTTSVLGGIIGGAVSGVVSSTVIFYLNKYQKKNMVCVSSRTPF